MRRVAGVVFDFDGVILDSENAEFEANRRIYERCGITLTPEEWCECIGVWSEDEEDQWCRRLQRRSAAAPDPAAYAAERRRLFTELIAGEPMRGIVPLLDQLHDAGIPAAIASSSPARWVIPAATNLGIAARMQAIVTGEDVIRRKPAPDIYLEAIRRLNAAPDRCVAIEDSGPGVQAAAAAGLKTIAVPHWLTVSHDLSAAHVRVTHAGEITLTLLDWLLSDG
jgi:HAD superfamily hydrolase (TIGR01509 family)